MRTKKTNVYEMDGKEVEIDLKGEAGKLLADLLKGGRKKLIKSKKITSKNKQLRTKKTSKTKRQRKI